MKFGSIIIYIYGLVLLVGLGLSLRQMALLRQLFKDRKPRGLETYKFLWPLWKKETLKKHYARNLDEEVLIDRLVKLRTINTIIFSPFILFWFAILILVLLTL